MPELDDILKEDETAKAEEEAQKKALEAKAEEEKKQEDGGGQAGFHRPDLCQGDLQQHHRHFHRPERQCLELVQRRPMRLQGPEESHSLCLYFDCQNCG